MYSKEQMREYNRKRNRERYDKGLCRYCENQRVEGTGLCGFHREYERQKSLADRQKMIEKGICYVCRKRPMKEGCQLCEVCVTRNKEKVTKNRTERVIRGMCGLGGCPNPHKRGKVYCEQHLQEMRDRTKARCRQHDEDGKCHYCGGDPVGLTARKHQYCEKCYVKMITRRNFGTIRRWKELLQLYHAKPLCPYTGRKLTLGINASLEHIIPSSRGGSDDLSNLEWVYCDRASGYDVNRMKGHMSAAVYKEAIREQYLHLFAS